MTLNALAGRFATAGGALAGGALIPLIGLGWGYPTVALAYGLLALLIGTLRVAQSHRQSVAPAPFRQALGDSLCLIGTLPAVRTLIVAGLCCEVLAFSHMTAIPLFAQDALAAGPRGLGMLNAALSIGGAIGVALLIRQALRTAAIPHARGTGGRLVSISIGAACAPGSAAVTPAGLVAAADAALYPAKQQGRDQVVTIARGCF